MRLQLLLGKPLQLSNAVGELAPSNVQTSALKTIAQSTTPTGNSSAKMPSSEPTNPATTPKQLIPPQEIAGPEQFAINLNEVKRMTNLIPGPFGESNSASGFGPVRHGPSAAQQQSEQMAVHELQKQQRSTISMSKISQRQALALQNHEDIDCRIDIDPLFQFAQIECTQGQQTSQLISQLSGPLSFVDHIPNKGQCIELGATPKKLKCN